MTKTSLFFRLFCSKKSKTLCEQRNGKPPTGKCGNAGINVELFPAVSARWLSLQRRKRMSSLLIEGKVVGQKRPLFTDWELPLLPEWENGVERVTPRALIT